MTPATRAIANRRDFPQLAAAVDLFRAHFGPGVRLLYGTEDGRELGKKPPPCGGVVRANRRLLREVGGPPGKSELGASR